MIVRDKETIPLSHGPYTKLALYIISITAQCNCAIDLLLTQPYIDLLSAIISYKQYSYTLSLESGFQLSVAKPNLSVYCCQSLQT